MSKNAQLKKKARQETKIKKAKRKKKIVIAVIALFLIALAIAIAISIWNNSKEDVVDVVETYSDGHQTVRLLADGTFTAALAHENESGIYLKTTEDGKDLIAFITEEGSALGEIADDALILPEEWQDDHGHNFVLPRL